MQTFISKRATQMRKITAWLVYDLANSVYPTLVTTFIFGPYFVKAVAADETLGTSHWGLAMGIAGLLVAVAAPLTGAIADAAGGRHKSLLMTFTLICVMATACLYWVRPDPHYVVLALVLIVISTVAFELAGVFYNSMLGDIAPAHLLGRISGWGWALGYAGGLMALCTALFGFIRADPPPFGLDASQNEPVRACMILVALWFTFFSIPLFLWADDRPLQVSPQAAIRRGLGNLARSFATLRNYPLILRFLIARMIYADGVNATFAFAGVYAAATFGMTFSQIVFLGIATNISAGLGAFLFGWMDDKTGAKRTIILSLCCLILAEIGALVTQQRLVFWILALLIGFFVGPVQAASRSFMVRIAPDEFRTQMLGLYALSGKVTAFVAPALLSWATAFFNSQRAGMSVLVLMLVAGLSLLLWLVHPAARSEV